MDIFFVLTCLIKSAGSINSSHDKSQYCFPNLNVTPPGFNELSNWAMFSVVLMFTFWYDDCCLIFSTLLFCIIRGIASVICIRNTCKYLVTRLPLRRWWVSVLGTGCAHSGMRERFKQVFLIMFMCMCMSIWGFVKLKKIQKSEKNSEVGGWVKPQLGLNFLNSCVFLCFLCCFHLSKCFKKKLKIG